MGERTESEGGREVGSCSHVHTVGELRMAPTHQLLDVVVTESYETESQFPSDLKLGSPYFKSDRIGSTCAEETCQPGTDLLPRFAHPQ